MTTGSLATPETQKSPPATAIPLTAPPRRRWADPRVVVAIAAVLSAAITVSLSLTIFSRLSVNNDEAVFLLQAKAIAGGHLFPQVGHPAGSFTPWLGVVHGGHYVLKYTPVVPAILALSLVLTGGYVAALAAWAMALVWVTYLLANEVTGNRRTAATAAVLMAASPLVMIQSALVLAYVPFLVLAELTFWALFAGVRRSSFRRLVFAGLCGGLGFVVRPLDALLMLGPAVGWLWWTSRGHRVRFLAGLASGLAAPAVGLLWFDAVATGSALKLPFSLFQSGDSLGFGVHRLYPGEHARDFGIVQGWQGLWSHLSLLGGGWVFGGLVLIGLAGLGLARLRSRGPTVAIAVGGLLLTVGYLCFWGTWNAAVLWGGVHFLGPWYLLPVLIPLTILGAVGLAAVRATAAWRAGLTVVAAAVISGVTLGNAINANAAFSGEDAALANAVAAQGRSLVFVMVSPNYLSHPTSVIRNATPPGGRTVYALQRGRDDFAALRSYPGRPLYRLRLLGQYSYHPRKNYGERLEHLRLVSARSVTLDLAARIPKADLDPRLVVTIGTRQTSWSLSQQGANHLRLTLSAGPGTTGRSGSDIALTNVQPSTDGAATLTIFVRKNHGREVTLDKQRLALIAAPDGKLQLLAPAGLITELGPYAAPAMTVQLAS